MSAAGDVLAQVSDPRLVEERRGQIVRAAVKLFSEEGYYPTTIQKIARAAGVSTGLIYQYFRDKDDILFLTLKLVLDTYEHDIPPQLEGVVHPVERLCMAVWTYCRIVDGLLDATVLAYRSTKTLRADRRVLVKDAETRTNRLIEACVDECVAGGHMREVNAYLLAYQLVAFAHAWALKQWSVGRRYALAERARSDAGAHGCVRQPGPQGQASCAGRRQADEIGQWNRRFPSPSKAASPRRRCAARRSTPSTRRGWIA